jgi:DNA polymerase-3 subunit alpha
MAVIVLEDPYGTIEAVVFPDAFAKAGPLIAAERMVLVRGRLEWNEETARMIASDVVPLERACAQATREVAIRLSIPPHDQRTFDALADIFEKHRGDRPVTIDVELRRESRRYLVHTAIMKDVRVTPSESLVGEVEAVLGSGAVTLR